MKNRWMNFRICVNYSSNNKYKVNNNNNNKIISVLKCKLNLLSYFFNQIYRTNNISYKMTIMKIFYNKWAIINKMLKRNNTIKINL